VHHDTANAFDLMHYRGQLIAVAAAIAVHQSS
jgi:hypothetical protein